MNEYAKVKKLFILALATGIYSYFAWDYGTLAVLAGTIVFIVVFIWIVAFS